MPKYEVVIEETLTYRIEVEAETEEEAEALAFQHDDYTQSNNSETDATVTEISEVE